MLLVLLLEIHLSMYIAFFFLSWNLGVFTGLNIERFRRYLVHLAFFVFATRALLFYFVRFKNMRVPIRSKDFKQRMLRGIFACSFQLRCKRCQKL